jgi:hypothetical protein
LIYGWRGSGILRAGTADTRVVNNTAMPYSGQSAFLTVNKSPGASGGTAEAWYNTNLRIWKSIFNKVYRVHADSGPGLVFNSNDSVTEGSTPYGQNSSTGDHGFLSPSGPAQTRTSCGTGARQLTAASVTPDGTTPGPVWTASPVRRGRIAEPANINVRACSTALETSRC